MPLGSADSREAFVGAWHLSCTVNLPRGLSLFLSLQSVHAGGPCTYTQNCSYMGIVQ